jgi:hypothetical protein
MNAPQPTAFQHSFSYQSNANSPSIMTTTATIVILVMQPHPSIECPQVNIELFAQLFTLRPDFLVGDGGRPNGR